MESDVKEILDKHENTLKEHTEDINELKIEAQVSKERYSNITNQLARIESNSLASNATNQALLASQESMTKTINKLIDSNTAKDTNDTQIATARSGNRKEVYIKVLEIVLIVTLGYFAIKGVTISLPTIKF